MKKDELFRIAVGNLWRTKLRTILTTLGVIIGIGALVSMVSFGTGMQKNITDVFYTNDLFTSMYATPQKVDMEQVMAGDVGSMTGIMKEPPPPLSEEALQQIRNLEQVEMAFPDIRFPVEIILDGQKIKTTLQAMPSVMGGYKPFNGLKAGHFFESDSGHSMVLTTSVLKKLNIRVVDGRIKPLSLEDSLRSIRQLPADSLLGKQVEIVTTTLDVRKMIGQAFNSGPSLTPPVKKENISFTITGIVDKDGEFGGRMMSDLIAPQKTVENIPRLGFSSVWDLMGKSSGQKGHSSLYVRVKHMDDLPLVRESIENMGFGVFSLADQLSEIKKGFLLFDTALGAVGTIALIVAALGIINTMLMSILERTREIGIMKAIGGSEPEIKGIFFVEAAVIGLMGGIFGLVLGWIVTRMANVVANYYIMKEGGPHINFFYIPLWLIAGAIGFSILVSLLAGLYPAIRAARVDPVTALRHD